MLPAYFTPSFLRQLELRKLRARRAYLGTRQGGHLSLKRGHGIEFSDYRMYEPGDSPRHIDWGVYARTDRLYVKRFQEEQDLRVLIAIDSSSSMLTPTPEPKWMRARDIALALAYVALLEQDSVRVVAPGIYASPEMYGGRAIHSVGKALMELEPRGANDIVREMSKVAASVRYPGMAIVLSDLLMPFDQIEAMFNVLRARNLDITAIQVLGPADEAPEAPAGARLVDSETGEELQLSLNPEALREYELLLREHEETVRDFFGRSGIHYARVSSTESIEELISNTLVVTGLLR